MTLAHPERLWLLAALPLLVLWCSRGRRLRARDWLALGREGAPPSDGGRLWMAAAASLILALAQPRWGRMPGTELPPGRDLILAVDASRSMAARDAVPDRLGLAVESAWSLLDALGPGDRAGLVAFAGRGVLRCPLTENLGAVRDALASLRPGEVRPGGTNLADALTVAAAAFDDQEHDEGRAIVVFSDGEDHAGVWRQAVEPIGRAGVLVHAVAVGDPEAGHPVPTTEGMLMYRGDPVLSRREDSALAALAEATGGAFVPLGLTSVDLGALFLERIAPVARRRIELARPTERVERYGLFVLAALVLGMVAGRPALRRRPPLAWSIVPGLAMVLLASAASPPAESAGEAVAAGRAAFAAGRFPEAHAAFERAAERAPSSAIPRYNAAAALFQLGLYGEAIDRYREARLRADPVLRTKIDYALGNASLAAGDPVAAVAAYDACLASTASGPDLEQVRRDAAINRRFALEQARAPAPGPEPSDGEPRPERAEQGDRPGPSADRAGESSPGDPGGAPPPDGPPPSGFQGPRGAGGAGGTSPDDRAEGSPDDRLETALSNIRDARRLRLPPPTPPDSAGEGKDW